jgi:methylated-DNA-[protein]-cysteine S-methyltransferase
MIENGRINTPIGPVQVFARDGILVFIDLSGNGAASKEHVRRRFPDEPFESSGDPGGCSAAFARYFNGDLTAIDALPVDPGGTQFQSIVWRALRSIPAGTTISYGELAGRIGARHAVRAVGAANGANPIPIVIPCHRVIGANGKLVGYGGGLERKAWLLRHESSRLFPD